ncbi:MAG: CO dehydrogenase/acetyl-CoA synthase complex subunit epsilon [Candidatus Methanoperedens sp.]|nr:CO dehydrogenase/acetyl-CoA synthase complex subunit epsilon [Candidatus Methanoperedens sp.]MCZ7369433.1 CO dehydrogenase/acetyl-CoA synthase complex subunit epsilon [Candidatus Methanoperedens sp.]
MTAKTHVKPSGHKAPAEGHAEKHIEKHVEKPVEEVSIKSVEKPPEKIIDTTRQAVPFDTGNIPGPKMAKAVMPAVSGKMLARAKRPLLIVGSQIHEEDVLAKVVDMGHAGIQIAAIGNAYKSLGDKGLDVHYANLHALASYLCDPNWRGLDGKGGYDLVVFFGITYYYASQAISALKNFSDIKVISLDKYYHPNAFMSFGNLKKDVFIAALDEVIKELPKR